MSKNCCTFARFFVGREARHPLCHSAEKAIFIRKGQNKYYPAAYESYDSSAQDIGNRRTAVTAISRQKSEVSH